MEPIIGYWLDPAIGGLPRTPKLGVRLEGRSELRPNSSTKRLSLLWRPTLVICHLRELSFHSSFQVCPDQPGVLSGLLGGDRWFVGRERVLSHIATGGGFSGRARASRPSFLSRYSNGRTVFRSRVSRVESCRRKG